MSIYAIADLHLSFSQDKPMSIFGENWEGHAEKIKNNWLQKVKPDDYVILPGDFSWAIKLAETVKDFKYLEKLPGKKILLKGNHDYWWTTLTNMRNFLEENNFETIDFLYNNSYCIENKIIVGTRGWNILDSENAGKMINRENARLKLSIENAIQQYGEGKEIIAFFHYPPITKTSIQNELGQKFIQTMKEYKIKKCYYGHLHGVTHKDAIEGQVDGITYKLISADYLKFNLEKI